MTTKGNSKEFINGYPFDRDAFFANFHGMTDLGVKVITNFIGTVPGMMTAINTAISEKNSKNLEISAHTLKGAVSHFHAEPCRRLAEALEKLGKSGDLKGCENILAELRHEIQVLLEAMLEVK
ncbi:MAG: hypothetical protein A4S09_03600 [Proteobacteria bacterium SG_bin7]|nr:MAG: hypothetical protein A4S09_03600 [Proteobacteria bacterium SG_bin7]